MFNSPRLIYIVFGSLSHRTPRVRFLEFSDLISQILIDNLVSWQLTPLRNNSTVLIFLTFKCWDDFDHWIIVGFIEESFHHYHNQHSLIIDRKTDYRGRMNLETSQRFHINQEARVYNSKTIFVLDFRA